MAKPKQSNPTIQMLDADTGNVEWSGTLDDFLKENRGTFSRAERDALNALRTKGGTVTLGGGAAPEVTVRR